MARIDQYSTRQPSRTDILLGTDEPTGRTSNFSLADLEDFLLSNKGDRKIPIEQRIDLTASEPESPVDGGRYLNTQTGTSSITSTAVVADYIYELRAGEWFELIPVEGFTLWDKNEKENITYAGAGYGWVSNTVSGAQLIDGLDGVNNSLDQNFTFDENGNITGFSEGFTSTVNTTVAGEGFATAQSVSEVGVTLGDLEDEYYAKVIDDAEAFAGIPHTFKQDDAPTDSDPKFIRNSVWYDTNDGNKAYVLEPESETPNAPLVWVEATDARLGELITEVGGQKNMLIDVNGHVAGMTMGNFGPDRSYVSFLADRFRIYNFGEDENGGTVTNPFVVENGIVKISELATRDITVGDVPAEAQSTVIFATTSNGINASTSKFDTDSGGNVTLTRTHVFLANTRWVDGDNLDSSWVFERIAGVDGTSVNIEGSVSDVASLPTTGNSPGDGYLISGSLYVWDGSQWNNAGNIQGPDGNDGITPSFGLDYQNGVDGSFHSYIYKVSDTQPTRPPSTGAASYQGSFDGVSEIIPNGWTDSPSVSTEDVEWVSKAIYENTKTYHPTTGAEISTWSKRTTAGNDWSEPVKIYQKGDIGDTGSPGADAYTVVLANETHTVPVSATSVHNYTGSGTSIVAYKGGTELQGRVSGTPGAGEFTVTPNTSGIQINGSPSVPSGSKHVTIPDMRDMANNTASVTYSINLEDTITIAKKQTFTKSYDGQPGEDGADGESITGTPGSPGKKTATGLIFYQVSSANSPTLPIAGNASFDFTDGSISLGAQQNSNWNTQSPSLGPGTSTSTFWSSRYYAVETNPNSDIGTLTFDSPVSMYSFDQVVTFTALGAPGDTIIDGGRIKTGTLSADTLSTGTIDAGEITIEGSLNSSNYDQNGENGFAAAGTEIDLSNGSIHSKNFKIDPDGSASFGGTHGSGSIGNWNITTDGTLKDSSNKIALDPVSKSITMRDSAGELKAIISANTSLSAPNSSNPQATGIGSVGTYFSFSTDSSLPVTNRSYSDHANRFNHDYSGSFSIPVSGAYEVNTVALNIQAYPSWLLDSISDDMPDVDVTVPSSMTQSMADALNGFDLSYGRTYGTGYKAARALIETILQVGEFNGSTWEVFDEKVLARQEIAKFDGERSIFYKSATGPRNNGDTLQVGYGDANGSWYRESDTQTNTVNLGAFEQQVDDNFILNLQEASSARAKVLLKITILPAVNAIYGTDTSLPPANTLTQWNFSRSSTSFSPLIELYGIIEFSAPVNFSEVSGGGLQVVTNSGKYVRMRRREADANPNFPQSLLDVKGGEVVLNNSGSTALRAYGETIVYGDITLTGDVNGVSISDSQSNQAYPASRLPGTQTTSSSNARFHQQNANTGHYVMLPGGTIIQWGHVKSGTKRGSKAITFPTAFPNGVGCVVCSTNRNSAGGSGYNHVYNYGRQGCTILIDDPWGFWVAFGY